MGLPLGRRLGSPLPLTRRLGCTRETSAGTDSAGYPLWSAYHGSATVSNQGPQIASADRDHFEEPIRSRPNKLTSLLITCILCELLRLLNRPPLTGVAGTILGIRLLATQFSYAFPRCGRCPNRRRPGKSPRLGVMGAWPWRQVTRATDQVDSHACPQKGV